MGHQEGINIPCFVHKASVEEGKLVYTVGKADPTMSESVVVALLSLLGTLSGAFGGVVVSNKLVNYRLTQVEKKVDQQTAMFERIYGAQSRLDVFGEQMQATNRRLEALEHYDM